MHRGYIKLWRKITEWSWYQDAHTLAIFIHLLVKSNHKDAVYMGYPVPKGSCVCGYDALKRQTGLTIRQIRTCFSRLKSTGDITVQTTNRFSVVRIVKYKDYQENSTGKTTGKTTINRQAGDKQATASKALEALTDNEKNENFLKTEVGRKAFREKIEEIVKKRGVS